MLHSEACKSPGVCSKLLSQSYLFRPTCFCACNHAMFSMGISSYGVTLNRLYGARSGCSLPVRMAYSSMLASVSCVCASDLFQDPPLLARKETPCGNVIDPSWVG